VAVAKLLIVLLRSMVLLTIFRPYIHFMPAAGFQSWVTWLPYGGGAVLHLAYDWFDTDAAAALGTFEAW